MKKQKGFSLIAVFLIIGALAAGGVVVWQRRALPTPTPTISSPIPTATPSSQTQPTTPPERPADQCTGLNEEECLAIPDCISVYGPSCPACMDVRFKGCRERQPGEIKKAPWGTVDTLSFSQLWQRRDELVGQRVSVKAGINLLTACPHYEGCCKFEECAATVILGETLGANYVSVFLHKDGERTTCRWPKENSNDCQGWEKDEEYLITGILSQERYNFNLEVLSKQRL